MATVSRLVLTSPHEVFEVLANGWYYSGWVVGASHMRAVEEAWPAVGSRLFHASGVWPATLRDETEVEEMIPDQRLVLMAKGRPFGEARIVLTLMPSDGGTLVTIDETPVKGPGWWLHNPATEAMLHRRNVEALARLGALAERKTRPEESGSAGAKRCSKRWSIRASTARPTWPGWCCRCSGVNVGET